MPVSGTPPPYTTYLWDRARLTGPLAEYPSNKPTVVVRPAPKLFALRPSASGGEEGNGVFALPYRVVWAAATADTVFLYDSQGTSPLGVVSGFHLDRITDLAWSGDASLLFVTSMDGYVSGIAFTPGELGVPLPEE